MSAPRWARAAARGARGTRVQGRQRRWPRAGSLLLVSKLFRGVEWGSQRGRKVQAGQVRQRSRVAVAHGGCLKASRVGSPCPLRRCHCCIGAAGCQCYPVAALILGQVNIDSRDITGLWSVLLLLMLLG